MWYNFVVKDLQFMEKRFRDFLKSLTREKFYGIVVEMEEGKNIVAKIF